jgi:hypothetical protein
MFSLLKMDVTAVKKPPATHRSIASSAARSAPSAPRIRSCRLSPSKLI